MNALKAIVGIGLLVSITMFMTGLIGLTRGCTQASRIIDKTIDADNVIYNYEYFKRQYHDIMAASIKVKNAETEYNQFMSMLPNDKEKWDWNDKSRINILLSNITGTKNVYRSMVAEYNARANMVNRNIFMGRDVPEQINPEY